MNDNAQLAMMLGIVEHVRPAIPWAVIPLDGLNRVLLVDRREDANVAISEAIARNYGGIIDSRTLGEWVGVLLSPIGGDADATAEKLRAAYAVATTDASDDSDEGPF